MIASFLAKHKSKGSGTLFFIAYYFIPFMAAPMNAFHEMNAALLVLNNRLLLNQTFLSGLLISLKTEKNQLVPDAFGSCRQNT